MAKQNGLVRLSGTIGDMTWHRSQDSYMVKEKTFLNGARIASDPKFKRTCKNMAEFANAGKAGKPLREHPPGNGLKRTVRNNMKHTAAILCSIFLPVIAKNFKNDNNKSDVLN
jgi:hypothetical protein